jgi:hypothetical protein
MKYPRHMASNGRCRRISSVLPRNASSQVGGDGRFDPASEGDDRLAAPGVDVEYRLTPRGAEFFRSLGIDPASPPSRRRLIRYCIDWSEQRHHLAGALGAALADRLFELGWVERARAGRAVHISDEGYAGLRATFGVELNAG